MGFTLIELLVVIAILAAMLLPALVGMMLALYLTRHSAKPKTEILLPQILSESKA